MGRRPIVQGAVLAAAAALLLRCGTAGGFFAQARGANPANAPAEKDVGKHAGFNERCVPGWRGIRIRSVR